MGFQYREHLIFPVAYLDPVIGDWTASVHIEFTEKLKIHTIVLRSDDVFETEVQAKRFTREAKEWVNDRLRTAREPRVKTIRKHVSPASSRSKQAMYWICRPCKINRHNLCLQESISRAGTNVKSAAGVACSQHTKHACGKAQKGTLSLRLSGQTYPGIRSGMYPIYTVLRREFMK